MRFEDFGLDERLIKAIKEIGYDEPTPIQEKCIPPVMQGKDVVGQSSTGSGKTAAFGLPILGKLQKGKGVQMLVLTPTRELCVQVHEALIEFAKYTGLHVTAVYGGVGYNPQIDAMRRAEVVVGTPGRILDHLRQNTLNLKKAEFVVLDEGDKMFEMGFIEDVEQIIGQCPAKRQTLLFSATFPSEIRDLVTRHMVDPADIRAEAYVKTSKLRQTYYNVEPRDKFSLLVHLLKSKTKGLAMVFCATRDEVSIISKNLRSNGIDANAIHGGLSQNKRLQALDALKDNKIDVLVATDVAARGLDIKNVTHIYNYDVPKTSTEYIHRVGRTARAGAEGDAVSLLAPRDYENFGRVLEDRSLIIKKMDMPRIEKVPFIMGERGGRRGSFRGRDEDSGSRGYGRDGPRRDGPRREGGSSYGERRAPGARSESRGGSSDSPRRDGPRRESTRDDGSRRTAPRREYSRDGGSGSGRGAPRSGGYGRGRDSDSGGFGERREERKMVPISGGFRDKPKYVDERDVRGGRR